MAFFIIDEYMLKKYKKHIFRLVGLVLLFFLFVVINQSLVEIDFIRDVAQDSGYIGIFLLSALSGFNILVPVPIIGFFPFFTEIGLHPVYVILIISVGMSCGDTLGFLIGRFTKTVMTDKSHTFMRRIEKLREKNIWLLSTFLFLYASVVPLPNELVVIPASFLGIRFFRVMIPVFFGNLTFNILAAFGLFHIFQLF